MDLYTYFTGVQYVGPRLTNGLMDFIDYDHWENHYYPAVKRVEPQKHSGNAILLQGIKNSMGSELSSVGKIKVFKIKKKVMKI